MTISLSTLVCRMLLVWFLFAANLLVSSVTWGYDAPTQSNTAYDGASISAFDYDSPAVLTANGEASRTAEENSLFEKCAVFFAAKTGEEVAQTVATQPNRIYSARELIRRAEESGRSTISQNHSIRKSLSSQMPGPIL